MESVVLIITAIFGGGGLVAWIGFFVSVGSAKQQLSATAESAKKAQDKLDEVDDVARDAFNKADAADKLASASIVKTELIATQFNDHKASAAERYGGMKTMIEESVRSLNASETRLAKAIDGLGDQFFDLRNRLDEVLRELLKQSQQNQPKQILAEMPTVRRTTRHK
jgi:hypothetical protein